MCQLDQQLVSTNYLTFSAQGSSSETSKYDTHTKRLKKNYQGNEHTCIKLEEH